MKRMAGKACKHNKSRGDLAKSGQLAIRKSLLSPVPLRSSLPVQRITIPENRRYIVTSVLRVVLTTMHVPPRH